MEIMAFLDKTFCASPNCTNECGRKMTDEEKYQLRELAYKGLEPSRWVSQAYFCGEPEEDSNE